MVGPHAKHGYSCRPEIFQNIAAMRAKEAAAKEKDAVSKSI
jgi:hypothetical protein